MKIVLLGQVRGGKNNMGITRTGRHYPASKKWVKWRDDAVRQIARQIPVITTFKAPVRATINYWKGDLRRRDMPAIMDAAWHVLERAHIVEDDCLITNLGGWIDRGLDRKNPKIEIEIEGCELESGA